MRPRARKSGLVVHELDGETVVYDLARHRAHRLNGPAAAIWRACNGRRTVEELGDPEQVWTALEKLSRAHLLDEKVPPRGVTRRRALKAIAAVPIVVSLLAPAPAQAASCFARGHPCVVGNAKSCCSQICIAGRCL